MSKTPSLKIIRPRKGTLDTFVQARTSAKALNLVRGRGHRALKAQDGRYAIVFRPAVAGNRQRRVRNVQGF